MNRISRDQAIHALSLFFGRDDVDPEIYVTNDLGFHIFDGHLYLASPNFTVQIRNMLFRRDVLICDDGADEIYVFQLKSEKGAI